MSVTGLEAFDRTLQQTHIWIDEVAKELGIDDKKRAFQGLRATLHVLRDRLIAAEAAQLGAQLPILLAGFYYEGWKPASVPHKSRSQEEFLNELRAELKKYFPDNQTSHFDPQQLAKAVFKVLSERVSPGEIEDIIRILPPELRELFPENILPRQ
jgi:uncharacterized protein (DUF2267 family)